MLYLLLEKEFDQEGNTVTQRHNRMLMIIIIVLETNAIDLSPFYLNLDIIQDLLSRLNYF